MKRLIFVFLFVATLAFAAAAGERVPVGTLAGTVVDAHGKAVKDASVTIQTSDGLQPHATHTDASGHFEFVRWEIGQYDLRAYSNGAFSDWSKRIVIRSNKTTNITLRLAAE
jgi:hypothetical protein